MPGKYAATTDVSEDRSLAEIRKTLIRYGADQFMFGYDTTSDVALLGFRFDGLQYRMRLEMPGRSEFRMTPAGQRRTSQAAIDTAWEQAKRQRWRALLLKIKAQLEWSEVSGQGVFDEFLPYALLPDNTTMGQYAEPYARAAQATGQMPPLLPGIKLLSAPEREE